MTEKYHDGDPMSDVISDDYRMLQILSRFGITLGFGDKSVAAKALYQCKNFTFIISLFINYTSTKETQ